MKLIRSPEIKRVLKAYQDAGGEIGRVDIRADSVSIYPPSAKESGLSLYDQWIADNDRPARHQ